MRTCAIFLFLNMIKLSSAGVSFVTLGDWGGAALEETSKPYSQNVKDVASQLEETVKGSNVQFIINTGDNFYWCGIQNTSDFQIEADWLKPFKGAALEVPWYSVLGNHEYAYNVDAQIEMSKLYKNWIMDARYFTRRVQLEGSKYATFIFLDTSPCVSEYRGDNQNHWDPCGSQYPTCSLSGEKDDFEGSCNFNQNIVAQDCSEQYNWYKKALAAVPEDDWLIVVGHHPSDEVDVEDFTSLMQNHGFDIYLNGHAHVLTQYIVDGGGAYVTSGAGSLVLTHDQLGGSPAKDRTYNKVNNVNQDFMANASLSYSRHSYKAVFHASTSGFTLHTFSDDYSTLKTDFLDTHGNTLHSFTVTKGASPGPSPGPAPGPSPGPAPGPSPSGGCCYSSDGTCSAGQTCCSHAGKSYASDSTCKRYGVKHNCVWDGSTCTVGSGIITV